MDISTDKLQLAIRECIKKLDQPLVNDVEKAIRNELEALCRDGLLSLGSDYCLTGANLEYRVRLLFESLDLPINQGRPGLEDFTIEPCDNLKPNLPLVIEVKSSRQPQIGRSELRQLDDWVFDLSGEERARKWGLHTSGASLLTGGLSSGSTAHHPNIHKGVMIFNGPLNIAFDQRTSCLGPNEAEFAKIRNFAVLPLEELIDSTNAIKRGTLSLQLFWSSIHSCEGLFSLPDSKI